MQWIGQLSPNLGTSFFSSTCIFKREIYEYAIISDLIKLYVFAKSMIIVINKKELDVWTRLYKELDVPNEKSNDFNEHETCQP